MKNKKLKNELNGITTEEYKKDKIRDMVKQLLGISYKTMVSKINKVLMSGAVDIEGWDEDFNSWIIPKIITTALLKDESERYTCIGKKVNNIRRFI